MIYQYVQYFESSIFFFIYKFLHYVDHKFIPIYQLKYIYLMKIWILIFLSRILQKMNDQKTIWIGLLILRNRQICNCVDHNINPFSNYLCLLLCWICDFQVIYQILQSYFMFSKINLASEKNGRKLTTISALFANKNNVVWFNSSYVWFKVAVYLTISSQKVFKFYYILFL